MKRAPAVCLVGGLLVALLWPVAIATAGAPAPEWDAACVLTDGTPNLGTAAIQKQDARWFIEGRIFDVDDAFQDWYDNATLSLGFAAPINEKTEFNLAFSSIDNAGADPIAGIVRYSDRRVLAPYVKRCISQEGNSTVSLTVGADIALNQARGMAEFATAYQDDFTPAAKLQVEWGKPGQVQWQLAGQVAFWDTLAATNMGAPIPGFGTVVAAGGGVCVPMGAKLTLVADLMAILSGDNIINSVTNIPDNELVWSAGGNWLLGGSYTTSLSIFATNAMGPTPASSIIGTPDNSVGFGIALRREF